MASNSFGSIFRMTTWGESHGKAIGVTIDGCPAGLAISEEEIREALVRRRPGNNSYTSPRKEEDKAEILSGVFEGKTTGAPILILIANKDVDSSSYEPIKDLLRPGHANFTYLEKYGIFDYRGGGRASGRETACRVAAGAVAKKLVEFYGIETIAYLKQIGKISATSYSFSDMEQLRRNVYSSPLFCPDEMIAKQMMTYIQEILEEGDSIGGVVEFVATNLPVGLGDPIYDKLPAALAKAMMSLPATKAFEIGSGFAACMMKGSEHNDEFCKEGDQITMKTNHSGGVLGGISTGLPLVGRVGFKPPSSIRKMQKTVTTTGVETTFSISETGRHDPTVAIRAAPVVEAMLSLVLADAILMQKSAKL